MILQKNIFRYHPEINYLGPKSYDPNYKVQIDQGKIDELEVFFQNNKVLEVLLITSRPLRKKYHVKEFENGEPDLIINTDEAIIDSYKRLEKLCAAFLGLAITKN